MNEMSESSLTRHLRDMEEVLLSPEVRSSPASLDKILADGFVEFGASGIVYDKQTMIATLTESSTDGNLLLSDFRLIARSDDFATVSYVCDCHDQENRLVRRSLRSSLWKNINSRWQMVFHQGTGVE